jgi:hypothetical protein
MRLPGASSITYNAMADFEAALRIDATDSDTISFINDLKRRQRGR